MVLGRELTIVAAVPCRDCAQNTGPEPHQRGSFTPAACVQASDDPPLFDVI